jgi:uncharacterized protein (DUF983 family)
MDYLRATRHISSKEFRMASSPAQPDRAITAKPTLLKAIGRGLLGRCPVCGKGRIFNGFLRVVRECMACQAPLGRARADDAPPYFTIMVTGHLVVPPMLYIDRTYALSIFAMSAIFLPLTLVLALALLRPIKGATVGAMLSLNLLKPHFDPR